MENLQLTNEIKQAFNSVNLPEIDLSDSVINSIKNAKYYGSKNKRVFAVSILAAVLLLTTTAFVAVRMWVLNDSNNNIVLRYREFDEYNEGPTDISEKLNLDSMMENLEPGKALVYYELIEPELKGVSENISIYPKPVKYTDLEMLVKKSGFDFLIPAKLPEGYAFAEGALTYDPQYLDFDDISKLREEAKNSGTNTAVTECETTSEVIGVNIIYQNDNKEFGVNISIWDGEDLYTDIQDLTIEHMTLNGREILYIEKEDVRKIEMRELLPDSKRIAEIIENGKAVKKEINSYIHYTISSKDLSKEELLEVVQSMIP